MENNISPTDIGNLSGLFVFTIDHSEFCINMQEVTGIIRTDDSFHPFKESDTHIRYRGDEYRIIPLNRIYNLNYNTSDRSRVLLLNINDHLYSLLVDKVNEVIAVKDTRYKTMSFLPDKDPRLNGVINYNGQEIKYPNYAKLIE